MFGPDSDASAWSQYPAATTVQLGSNAMNTTGTVSAGTVNSSGNVSAAGTVNGVNGLRANTNLSITHYPTNGGKIMTQTMTNLALGTNGTATALQISATGNVGIGKLPSVAMDVNGQVSCSDVNCTNANISGDAYITGDALVSGNFEAVNIDSTTGSSLLVFDKSISGGDTTSGTNLGRIDFKGWKTSSKTGAQILARQEGTATTGVPASLQFYTSDGTNVVERMNIGKNGRVAIGTPPSNYALEIVNKDCPGDAINLSCADVGGYATIRVANGSGTTASFGIEPNASGGRFYLYYSGGHRLFIDRTTGAISIPGNLSKGSGSFKIDHPLKPESHYLVHSFVEAPKADLNYRGIVKLVGGRAVVNIDTVAGMTEGTFVALCRDVQCFTSSESDWTHIRGKVEGNILTIEAQDPLATSSVSWLVIGERQDKHMYETGWTDDEGRVIVEPAKEQPTA